MIQPIISRIRLAAFYVALLLPLIIYGAVNALQSSNNSPIDWVDSSFTERAHYDEFVQLFGPGDVIVASWSDLSWDDERLDLLVNELRQSKLFQASDGTSLFYRVTSGREALRNMVRPPQAAAPSNEDEVAEPDVSAASSDVITDDELPSTPSKDQPGGMLLSEAIRRLTGTLIGKDGQMTCLVVTLNSTGLAARASVVSHLQNAIVRLCEVSADDIHMAGPVIDGLTVDLASQKSLTTFAAPSALLIFLICWWSLGSFLSGAVVFLTAAFCQATLLALIYFSGQRLSALLIILPPLVQVLTVSGGVHLMNYYLTALETLSPPLAAIDAFRKGWLPSLLSLGTTAIGTASLMVSGLEPIRLFGMYGTLGVLLTSATVLTVIPCSMIMLGKKRTCSVRANASHDNVAGGVAREAIEVDSQSTEWTGWRRLATFLNNYNTPALFLLFGAMAVGAVGLPRLSTSIRIETLFPPDSKIMQDYHWLEDQLGPLVPIEVLIRFDKTCTLNDRLRMDLLWRTNNAMLKHSHVHSTFSALTLFPPTPPRKSLSPGIRSAILNKSIHMARPAFEQMGMLRAQGDDEVWRITARVSALEALNYGQILESLRVSLDQELQQHKSMQGVTLQTSGIMPLVHQIQGRLLSDLFSSLMWALVVITITMTIVEAGLASGILTMASNVFPIVVAFGCMGWFAHPMDIGSVMTASVALGIAVDDTLHFLAFFRRTVSEPGVSRLEAVSSAYRHCGLAMIQTSTSCGLGLFVFAFSDFVPTGRFAILMALLLLLALLADLILLPAILLSPLGRLFEPGHHDRPVPTP